MQIWFCFTYLEVVWIFLRNWRLRNSLYLRTLAGCFCSGAVAQTVEMFPTNLTCLKWKSSILMQACSCSSSSSLVSWWLLPVPPLPSPLGVPGEGLLEPFLVTAVAVASKCCLQQPSPTNLVRVKKVKCLESVLWPPCQWFIPLRAWKKHEGQENFAPLGSCCGPGRWRAGFSVSTS